MAQMQQVNRQAAKTKQPGPMDRLDLIAALVAPPTWKSFLREILRRETMADRVCKASIKTLAADVGIKKRQGIRIIQELANANLIRVEERPGMPSLIHLNDDELWKQPKHRKKVRRYVQEGPPLRFMPDVTGDIQDTTTPVTLEQDTGDIYDT